MTSFYLRIHSGAAKHTAVSAGTRVRGRRPGWRAHRPVCLASSNDPQWHPWCIVKRLWSACASSMLGENWRWVLPFQAASILKSQLSTVHPLPHHKRKPPLWSWAMKVIHVGGPQTPEVLKLWPAAALCLTPGYAFLESSWIHRSLFFPPGCHPHDHACLQKLFRYVSPAVHFNSTEVSGSEWGIAIPVLGVSG